MDIILNSDNRLFLADGSLLGVILEAIDSDGNVTFRGSVLDIKQLKLGQKFILKSSGFDRIIAGTILKIRYQQVFDLNAPGPDDRAEITMVIDTVCSIEYCWYFEEIE